MTRAGCVLEDLDIPLTDPRIEGMHRALDLARGQDPGTPLDVYIGKLIGMIRAEIEEGPR